MTDRRSDGRAIAYMRYSIYAVARKNGPREFQSTFKERRKQVFFGTSAVLAVIRTNNIPLQPSQYVLSDYALKMALNCPNFVKMTTST